MPWALPEFLRRAGAILGLVGCVDLVPGTLLASPDGGRTAGTSAGLSPLEQTGFTIPTPGEGNEWRLSAAPGGSISCDRASAHPLPAGATPPPIDWNRPPWTFDFGLPRRAPERRWIEEDRLPIFHAEWLENGIRYTQTLLVTDPSQGAAPGERARPGNLMVLMVRLSGRNANSHYQLAQVALTLRVDGRPTLLTMEDRRVMVRRADTNVLCAIVDGQVEGRLAEGGGLGFSGDMPPGTDGFMVIKIPLGNLDLPHALEALQDLDFEDEFRRMKRYWKEREGSGKPIPTTAPE